jgi:ATP synthase protein I
VAARRLSTVSKILIYQFVIITIVVFGFAVVEGWQWAFSSLLGGATAFLPNIYFGWQVSRTASKSARNVVNAFYFGEVGKWLLTIVLFVLVFNIPNIEIFPLLATYMLAISVFWFALLMR